MKYIKKPVAVQAKLFEKGDEDGFENLIPFVNTLEGKILYGEYGNHYVVNGNHGDKWLVRKDIFEETYQLENPKFIDRLLSEWREHGKIIIAIDFDDTIFPFRTFSKEELQKTISILKVAKETGAYLIVHTACNEDRYESIKSYCDEIGLAIDGINVTPINVPFGKNGAKIYANIFIDDRGGINEALNILETAMYRIRGERNTQSTLNQTF